MSVSTHSLLGVLSHLAASVCVGRGTAIASGSYWYGSQIRLKTIRFCTRFWVVPILCPSVSHPSLSLRLQLIWTCGSCAISINGRTNVCTEMKMKKLKLI